LPYFAYLGWTGHLLALPGRQWHMFIIYLLEN
jgi:hypothetical protein